MSPANNASRRSHDIVILGATGFTGGLTAEYLAANTPEGVSWAIAGRNRAKLETRRAELAKINSAFADLPLIEADSNDPAALQKLAKSTRVVITTVGPYLEYGEPLVAACAAAGTDYVDLTGEPEFVDAMYNRHHRTAASTGARIVHCCGFDSIPHDLGAMHCVQQLPDDVPLEVQGFVRAGGTFSGGTFHSALNQMSRPRSMAAEAKQRKQAESSPADRRARAVKPSRPLRKVDGVKGWAAPFPTIDPQVIVRSARELDSYGPEFSYGHNIVLPNVPTAVGLGAGVAGMLGAAQVPPLRKLLGKLKDPGDGPTPEQREKAWFKVRFIGTGGGKRVVTEVSGGDPGYGETSKMLAESALCLATDDLPETAGQLTPAVAMGDALRSRLERAGIGFDVIEPAA